MNEQTDRFDQADYLRAAALILDELGDFQMHPWAACVDACRDLTNGNRGDAGHLAWTALTGVLDVECIWDGPRGARRLAMRPPPDFTMNVPCPHPRCRAAMGEPCLQRNGAEKVWPHEQRETDAVASREVGRVQTSAQVRQRNVYPCTYTPAGRQLVRSRPLAV